MGGKGPGHKSPRARQSRLINIQKARAARRRAPLPWRSGLESQIIEQLVWQWWLSPAPRWPALRVARLLGVSHTWVNKLAKRFHSDPARFRRRFAPFPPATLEKLDRARQETLRRRQLGWLRGPIRLRRVRYTLPDGRTRSARLPTKSSRRGTAPNCHPEPGHREGPAVRPCLVLVIPKRLPARDLLFVFLPGPAAISSARISRCHPEAGLHLDGAEGSAFDFFPPL